MASTSGSEGEFSKDTASFTREYCNGNRGWIRKSMLYIFLEGKHVTDISFIAGMLHQYIENWWVVLGSITKLKN